MSALPVNWSLLTRLEALVQRIGRPWTAPQPRLAHLLLIVLLAGPIYGAAMGSFHFAWSERVLMVLFAAAKVPLLIFATALLCLPAFFVVTTVLRLREDLTVSLRAIAAAQAALTLALASLAPVTRFAYWNGLDHRSALLFNMAMFTLATAVGHVVMLRRYRVLVARNPRHRVMLWMWVVMYAFVGMQMGWTLRPFVGTPGMAVTFFREGPFTNAYVEVGKLLFQWGRH